MYQERTALLRIVTKYQGDELRQAIDGTDKLEKAIRETYQAYERQNRIMDEVYNRQERLDQSTRSTAENIEESARDYLRAEQNAGKYADSLRRLINAAEDLGQDIGLTADEIENFYRDLDYYETQVNDTVDISERWARTVQNLKYELDQLEGAEKEAREGARTFEQQLKEAKITMGASEDEAKELGQAYKRVGEDAKDAGRDMNRAAGEMKEAGNKTKDAFSYIQASITGALTFAVFNMFDEVKERMVEFIKESTVIWAEYDAMVRQTFAQTPGMTQPMRDELKGLGLDIAQELGYLPTEVIPSIRRAFNLGLDEDNLLDTITDASKAARVGMTDLEDTIVRALSIQKAYGDGVYSTAEILDQMAFITQNSVLEQSDLNEGLAATANVAAEAGVKLHELAGVIVTMSNQGDDWQEIMSYLVNTLTQIQITGTALGGLFEEASGMPFREYIDAGGDFVSALMLLEEHADRVGDSVLNLAGGDSNFYRDMQAALGVIELLGRHMDDVQVNVSEAANATGLLDQAYKEVATSIDIHNQKADATVAAAQVVIGQALEPETRMWNNLKIAIAEATIAALENSGASAKRSYEAGQLLKNENDSINELVDNLMELGETSDAAFRGLNYVSTTFGSLEGQFTDVSQVETYINALTILTRIIDTDPGIALEDAIARLNFELTRLANLPAVVEDQDYWSFIYDLEPAADTAEKQAFRVEQAVTNMVDSIKEVTDGDTYKFEIEGELVDIRLAGIDTPETPKEWSDLFAERLGMPGGDEAMEFAQDILMSGKVTFGEELGTSFDRSVRELFVDGERLATIIGREGLAIPAFMDIKDIDTQIEIATAVRQAAEAGKGIFEDSKIRAAYLAGEVKTMEDIINLYPSMQVAADEYTQAFEDSADVFERIADAQRELAEADTTEKQIEAQRELEAAHRAVGDAYREYAINKRLEDVGATQSTLDLAVALGVLSQEEADARAEFATIITEIDKLEESMTFATISTESQKAAVEGLANGLYATAEAAIAAAAANEAWNAQAAITGDTDLTDKLFRQSITDKPEFEPFEFEVTVKRAMTFEEEIADMKAEIRGATTEADPPYEAEIAATYDLDKDPWDTFYGELVEEGQALNESVYKPTVDVQGAVEGTGEIEALEAAAVEAEGDYYINYWVTTYYNTQGQPSGPAVPSGMSGGFFPSGGTIYVGEDGPEYVNLPPGSNITSAEQVREQERAQVINMNVTYGQGATRAQVEATSRQFINEMKKAGLA